MKNTLIILMTSVLICLNTSCINADLEAENTGSANDSGSYVVRCDDYVYYYKYGLDVADLYRYDLNNNTDVFVDNLKNSETKYWGTAKMFLIDGRLYYSKSTDKADVAEIYSVDVKEPQPRFEGSINEMMEAHFAEFVEDEFKIFKFKDSVYTLANNNVYAMNGDESECVYEGVCGICVDGDKIYYSLLTEDERNSGGIMCWNTSDNTHTEIISADAVREYNRENTIFGDTCTIQNIFLKDGTLYFLTTDFASDIYKYSINGEQELRTVTEKANTRLFRMQGDMLYYIDLKHRLCSVDTNGTEQKEIIPNEYVFAFNIYDDKIYYYRTIDDRGYPAGLVEMDIQTGERKIIAYCD